MDVAAKVVVLAQAPRDLDNLLHRVVRRADDPRREEQPLNVIALIEGERELDDLLRREPRAPHVRALAVDAISAIKDAAVGQQNLEQGNAAPVRRIGMAN